MGDLREPPRLLPLAVTHALEAARASEARSVAMLGELVRIPSRTGEEGTAQEFLAHRLRQVGANVRIEEADVAAMFAAYPGIAQYPTHWQHDLVLPYAEMPDYAALQLDGPRILHSYRGRPNVTALLAGSGGGPSLILNGHIDTVTTEPDDAWHTPPFGAEIRDGRLYGRGSSDMKGGLCAAVMALTLLREAGFQAAGDITLQSVVNEEHAGNGTLDLVRRGQRADVAIVLEPTDNRILTAAPGGLYWQIVVPGVARSPGARWEGDTLVGVSAIELLPKFITALLELERSLNEGARHGMTPCSLVLGKVIGGSYESVTAGAATLRGVVYFAPELGMPQDLMRRLGAVVAAVNARHPLLAARPARIEYLHHNDGVSDGGAAAAAALLAVSLVRRGLPAAPQRAPFCCDLRHLVNRGGMPGLVFGPGSIAEAHRPNESIGLGDYLAAIEILIEFIGGWCAASNPVPVSPIHKELSCSISP